MSIKVRDLAKELGILNEELIEALNRLYVEVDDERSSVDNKIADLMRVKLGVSKPAVKKTQKEEKQPKGKGKAEKKVKAPAKKKKEAKKTEKTVKTAEVKTEKLKPGRKKKAEAAPLKPEKVEEEVKKPQETVAEKKPSVKEMPKVIVVKHAAVKDAVKEREKVQKEEKDRATAKKEKKPRFEGKKPIAGFRKRPPGRRVTKVTTKFTLAAKKAEIAYEEIKSYEGTDFKKIQLQVPISIRALAVKVNKRPNDLIQYMMRRKIFVSINQDLEEPVVRDLLKDLGYELELPRTIEEDLMAEHRESEKAGTEPRAAVVTFMGHVDHGKTSLLDYIRKTMVTKKEKGGITQHIGAYKVETSKGSVTFLDTPGHEAFTAMRARGANATDVVVLVVAADDGVMPQTKEAIDHARAANVPIVIAVNKCDLPGANPDKVKIALQKERLVAEDLGGKTVVVEVSAKTGQGVDDLVEMLMLETELLELKANPGLRARGVVIEGKKTSGHGVVATVLVKNGILRGGDIILSGVYYGKVKAMINDRGERITEAPPSTPVEILGLQGVPEAGDEFFVVKDEKKAKTLALLKQGESKKSRMTGRQRITLEDFHNRVLEGEIKELKIILKADVQGSVEAITHSLENLSTEEVKVSFAHTMVGDVNESDVMLAVVSNAVIIGFNVKVEPKADTLVKQEKIDIRIYDVIYEAISDVKAAMEGLLEPIEREALQGIAQVKEVFPMKNGKAAGCMITKGVVHRKDRIRVKRAKEVIFKGEISSLRRFRDDVREVKEGFECGISLHNFNNINPGDIIEAYIIEKVARRLEK